MRYTLLHILQLAAVAVFGLAVPFNRNSIIHHYGARLLLQLIPLAALILLGVCLALEPHQPKPEREWLVKLCFLGVWIASVMIAVRFLYLEALVLQCVMISKLVIESFAHIRRIKTHL